MAEIDLNAQPRSHRDVDASLGDLVSQLTADFGELVSTQVQLAKVEIKEEVARAGKGAGLLTGAGLAGFLALMLSSFAAAWGLDEVMPAGWAFLIVGAVWLLIAATLYATGRKQLDTVQIPPPQTKASIEEDIEWAKRHKS